MSIFSDALEWVVDTIDQDVLGYATNTAGPARQIFDFGDQLIDDIRGFAPLANAAQGFLDPEHKKFQAPGPSGTSYRTRAGGTSANFRAAQTSAPKLGVADPRVQNAWNRVRQTQNNRLAAQVSMIYPTIRSTGPTAKLSTASISRRKKA